LHINAEAFFLIVTPDQEKNLKTPWRPWRLGGSALVFSVLWQSPAEQEKVEKMRMSPLSRGLRRNRETNDPMDVPECPLKAVSPTKSVSRNLEPQLRR